MPFKPLVARLAVAALLVLLALAPGSLSAQGAPTADALDVALAYLDKNAAELGVTRADVGDLIVTSKYRSAHNGVTHVNLNQRFRDLEVFTGHVTVNVADDGGVVFAAGSLVPDLAGAPSGSAALKATDAVEAAADALKLEEPADLEVISAGSGPAQETVVSGGGISTAPIPLRLGWQPTAGGLRLAWQLVIDDSSDAHLWNATVDAETGALLASEDWTSQDKLDALAATLARTGTLGTAAANVTTPTPVADGSSYRVLELPKESPNDGAFTVVTNPADATASPFGWHDTNGAAGPEFTIPRGNNAHAYMDQDDSESPDAAEPDGGPTLTFDFTADLTNHAQNYRPAAVTNLFYWNNTIHDVMYRYGFTEAAGNFQANNYGRGGTQGDYVRAEAADGGGTNNANFSTPVETATSAGTPRMQMYLWPGNQYGPQNQVVADGVGSFGASWSRFGPSPTPAGIAGELVYAGTGCTAAAYPATLPSGDWIALVDGGTAACSYLQRVQAAEAKGADAVVVAHNTSAAAPVLTASMSGPPVGIPPVAITQADGNAIKAALASGPVTGTVRHHPDHPGIRDGDLENGIIIHEYGHGISIRLTGGPATNCLTGTEQGGEGWSDLFAILMTLNPDVDDPEGPRGMGPYALFQDSREGNGIRPRPYSRNMEIQPFTYDSIKTAGWLEGATLAAPHGVGHGWAAVLWDVVWELVEKHGYNPNIYGAWDSGGNNRALQYVIDGLKMQGCAPGFVVARGAIIAASEALGGEDTCTLWAAFARRGLGYSAVQGGTGRDDNTEAFDTHPDCRRGFTGGAPAAMNVVNVGSTVALEFDVGGNEGLDILVSNSPYSRQVDCNTLATVTPGQTFITPRPLPIPTETPGNAGLQYDAETGEYRYPWKTDEAWEMTCREVVVTRKDGVQHRAYFRFDSGPSHRVSGYVRDPNGNGLPNVSVAIEGTPLSPEITDATGFYSFPAVSKGTYTATATPAGGCNDALSQQLVVQRNTTLNFILPQREDAFGYRCTLEPAPFEEAGTPIALAGDDVATTVDLPFAFPFYGFRYTRAHVCSNGFVELVGVTTTTCPFSNVAIPATGRPNSALYPFWDDLVVDAAASVRTETKGAAPSRRFVIEYRNVHVFGETSQRLDFAVVLHENGEIQLQYRNLDNAREQGDSATMGIENHAGSVAFEFSRNRAALSTGAVTSVRYTGPPAPPAYTLSGHVRDTDGAPVANATVTIEDTPIVPAVTGADGFYEFEHVPQGTWEVSTAAPCKQPESSQVTVSGDTTHDVELGIQTDAFGYTCDFVDEPFTEGDTVLTAVTGDDVAANIALPFAFTLYGTPYTTARVCSNGFVELGATTLCPFSNSGIPSTARPNGAIYGFWDDLYVDASASVRTGLSGTAPNRRFVIEWRNVRFLGDTTRRIDVSIVLEEGGAVLAQYRNLADDARERGSSATLGIENGAGTIALQASLNRAVLPAEPAVATIRYQPPA